MRRALLAAMLLAGCGSSPETFAEADPHITAFDATGPNLNFTVRLELVTENSGPTQLGMVIGEIAKGVQAGLPGVTAASEYAQVQVQIATQDKLGNEGSADLGTVRIPVELLREANMENLTGAMWLELVDQIDVANPGLFASALAGPCIDDEAFFSAGAEWCSKVVEAVAS